MYRLFATHVFRPSEINGFEKMLQKFYKLKLWKWNKASFISSLFTFFFFFCRYHKKKNSDSNKEDTRKLYLRHTCCRATVCFSPSTRNLLKKHQYFINWKRNKLANIDKTYLFSVVILVIDMTPTVALKLIRDKNWWKF